MLSWMNWIKKKVATNGKTWSTATHKWTEHVSIKLLRSKKKNFTPCIKYWCRYSHVVTSIHKKKRSDIHQEIDKTETLVIFFLYSCCSFFPHSFLNIIKHTFFCFSFCCSFYACLLARFCPIQFKLHLMI